MGDTIEIDGKVITKKNGYYLMDVKTGEDEFYCNFVGAVQSELGVSYDDALNVCLKNNFWWSRFRGYSCRETRWQDYSYS